MAQKKTFAIGALVLLLLIGGIIAFVASNGETITELAMQSKEGGYHEDEVADNSDNPALQSNQVDPSTLTQNEPVALPVSLAEAARERILGNSNAPIKISEHSSFSCGHCGKFHQNVFKDFKANWIDTGKAYLVFSDFPLNAPALHASLVGRCIADDDQYFAYVEEVFAKQNDWAYIQDYLTPLKAIAANYGINSETFNACMNNQELQDKLLGKIRAAQQQFGVNSTPSFVVNNAVTISGTPTYEQFNEILEGAIAESQNPAAGTEEGTP